MAMRVTYLLPLVMLMPSVAQAQSFNLECSVKTRFGTPSEMMKKENQFPGLDKYRIDLGQRRWCQEKCTETEPIVELDDRLITLKSWQDQDDADISWVIQINRESGRIFNRMTGEGDVTVLTTGDCTRQPFTGFPVRKF